MDKTVAMLSVAMVAVSSLAAAPLAVAIEDDMNQILGILKRVTGETMNTLDRGWEIALKFKDPNYRYDPSELGVAPKSLNETIPGIRPPSTSAPTQPTTQPVNIKPL